MNVDENAIMKELAKLQSAFNRAIKESDDIKLTIDNLKELGAEIHFGFGYSMVDEVLFENTDDDNEMLTNDKWSPPKSISRAIKKVNDWAGQRFDEIEIQTKQKRMMEKLLFYLKSPRFVHFINQYSTLGDRD